MTGKGKWDPSQRHEWERRYRQVVEVVVPTEETAEVEVPMGPVGPEAFSPPAKKNHGPN